VNLRADKVEDNWKTIYFGTSYLRWWRRRLYV